ncbi:MAG: pentapeptide repeat-containing protein [Cyanobacteria bacterium P01_F01_bin.53]
MPNRNFSHQNLRGRSFKGQDLTGADFTNARLQGAVFTNAELTGATFQGAKAGSSVWTLVVVRLFLIFLGISIGFTGVTSGVALSSERISAEGWTEAMVLGPILLVFMGSLFFQGPSMALLATSALIFVGFVVAVIPESFLHGGLLEALWGEGQTVVEEIGSVGIALWAALIIYVMLSGVLLASARCKGARKATWGFGEGFFILAVLCGSVPGFFAYPNLLAKAGVLFISSSMAIASIYVARQSLAEHSRFSLLRQVALALSAFGGTRFDGANLTGVNFYEARLNCADFRRATLRRTQFLQSQLLDFSRPGDTILRDRSVRHLLATHQGRSKSYKRANLRDAYLAHADLNGADFTGAIFSGADCTGAWLECANLAHVIALGTEFEVSHLSGACLEGWSIDMSTGLEDVNCSHVYLLRGDSESEKERRPNSGKFEPGEFARLFQEALNTVDLIFRNGLDLSAFLSAFRQVQIEHEDKDLSIRSIENKGDGMMLVKVEVPDTADRELLHRELSDGYAFALSAVEDRYKAELAAKDEQIEIHRGYQNDLKELTKLLSPAIANGRLKSANPFIAQSSTGPLEKRVVLKVNTTKRPVFATRRGENSTSLASRQISEGRPGGLPDRRADRRQDQPVSVTLQIGLEGAIPHVEVTGALPNVAPLRASYERWQQAYKQLTECTQEEFRIQLPAGQLTNVNYQEVFESCRQAAEQLRFEINQWLNSELFRSVKEKMLEQLQPTDSIRFFWQTDDLLLRQLPLQVWNWFDRYAKAELIVSDPTYWQLPVAREGSEEVRILSILGDRTGIDVESDQALLATLPNVRLRLLSDPSQQQLTDQLWEKPWDVLFFAGHSDAPDCDSAPGRIRLNATESLSFNDLKYGLRKATERGLKLAIFNTCDGLGLLRNLEDVPIPPIVVMRHPVPDQVAQTFLKNFLQAFSEGLPLHQAVREAREKLQGIETIFPYATWLPVVCQNPGSEPLTWQNLYLD